MITESFWILFEFRYIFIAREKYKRCCFIVYLIYWRVVTEDTVCLQQGISDAKVEECENGHIVHLVKFLFFIFYAPPA